MAAGGRAVARTSMMRSRSGMAASAGITEVLGIKGMNALIDRGVRGEALLLPPAPMLERSVLVTTRRRTVTSLQRDLTDTYNSALEFSPGAAGMQPLTSA